MRDLSRHFRLLEVEVLAVRRILQIVVWQMAHLEHLVRFL
jgi:hypothetical protein